MKVAPVWLGVLLVGLMQLSACGRYRDKPLCDDFFVAGDTQSFALDAQGLAVDAATGLSWYRCNAGERFRDGQCVGLAVLATREDALSYVQDFNRQSDRTWRLPSQQEMQTILNQACVNPAVNRQVFPSVVSDSYWNSDRSRHGDYMGCTTNTYSAYTFCREMATNQRPFMLVTGRSSD